MLLARNKQTGNDVFASDPAARKRGYICPFCKAPVELRAGYHRQPYFAHVAHRALPECELYHESLKNSYLSSNLTNPTEKNARSTSAELPNLYLGWNNSGSPELRMKLPRVNPAVQWTGTVCTKDIIGERKFKYDNLRSGAFIAVVPQFYSYTVRFNGNVDDEYRALFQEGITGLSTGKNIFRSSENLASFLSEYENVYWGERYMALIHRDYQDPNGFPFNLKPTTFKLSADWLVLDITLPSKKSVSEKDSIVISDWLGRKISEPPARAYLWRPFPIYFSEDGSYVIPKEANYFEVRRTKESKMMALDDFGNELVIIDQAGEILKFFSPEAKTIHIYLDNKKQFSLQKEECTKFTPRGVTLGNESDSITLFEAYSNTKFLQKISDNPDFFCLRFQNPKLTASVTVNDSIWQNNAQVQERLREKKNIEINAGAFGYVLINRSLPAKEKISVSKNLLTQAVFLSNLASDLGQFSPFKKLRKIDGIPVILEMLIDKKWDRKFLPQLSAFQDKLKEVGLL